MKNRYQFRHFHRFLLILLIVLWFPSPAPAAVKLKKTSLSLKKGNVCVLRLTGNSKGAEVTWKTSAGNKVAIVSSGHNRVVLRAKRTGKSVISAKIGKRTLKCTVTVKKNAAFPTSLTLCKGDKFTFTRAKKAAWSLSNAKKGSLSAVSGKKVTFTAKKTGTVKVIAARGKKTYPCTIKIIRKDGATKADLAEEKAIAEAKDAKPDDSGSSSDTDTGTDSSKEITLTDPIRNMLVGLSYSACTEQLDTDRLTECNIHNMDLSNETIAFMLYRYVYMYAGLQDTEADLSVIGTDTKTISPAALKAFMRHLFGEVYLTAAWDLFISKYPQSETSDAYIFDCIGDFGDAGNSFFEIPDSITINNDMVCLSGRVMCWNEYAESYVHSYTYKTYWYHRTEERTVQLAGTDSWFQFDHVEIL